MRNKLKVGFFSLTCCEGCVNTFVKLLEGHYGELMKMIEIKYCRMLKSNNELKGLDIAFVEGAVATKKQLSLLKKIRKNTRYLVALGSGAVNGMPASQRNNFPSELKNEIKDLIKKDGQRKKIQPIKDFVEVDDCINGCPVGEKEFMKKLRGYAKNA